MPIPTEIRTHRTRLSSTQWLLKLSAQVVELRGKFDDRDVIAERLNLPLEPLLFDGAIVTRLVALGARHV